MSMNVGSHIYISTAHAPSQMALNDLTLMKDPLFDGEPFAAFIGVLLFVQAYPDVPAPDWLAPIVVWAQNQEHELIIFTPGGLTYPAVFPTYAW